MGALDQVTQMKNQNLSEEDIVGKLKEQGISPKAIHDAMDQSKIKEAVSKPVIDDGMDPYTTRARIPQRGPKGPATQELQQPVNQPYPNPQQPYPQSAAQQYQQPQQDYYEPQPQAQQEPYQQPQQSAAQQYQQPQQDYYEPQPQAQQDYYEPQPQAQQDYYEPQPEYEDQGGYEDYEGDSEQGYDEEYYPQEGYGQESYGSGTDTMIEIAEQVFIEKTRKMQEQLEDLNEFKTLAGTKLTNATSRLKRIEESIDKLQMAILEEVGSYGRGLDNIKKEMSMMQESFSKTLPALVHRQTHHHTTIHKPVVKKTVSRRK